MHYFLAALAFFLAGMVPELTGFGVSMTLMVILSFLLPIKLTIPLVAVVSLLVTGIIFFQTRESFDWQRVRPLLIGAIPGVPLGLYFLTVSDESLIRTILAILLIFVAIYGLIMGGVKLPNNNWLGILIGWVSGFFGASFNINGPLLGLYSNNRWWQRWWRKDTTKNVVASYMFFVGIAVVIGHGLTGRLTDELFQYLVWSLPFLGLGMFVGGKLFDKLSRELLKKVVYLAVLVGGIVMLL